jgi:periplasmic protein TonB
MIVQRCLVPADARLAGVAGAQKERTELSPRRTAIIAGKGKPGAPVNGVKGFFAEAMLENSSTRAPRRRDFAVSAGVQLFFLAALLFVPLYFTEALDVQQLSKTLLVVPPPAPAPPPLVPARSVAPKTRTSAVLATLVVPTVIPNRIAHVTGEPNEADLETAIDPGAGVSGGVAGGIPGGQLGGVLGGASSGPVRPAAIDSAPNAPIRVGGKVRPPRVLFAPQPVYPILARQARISGPVVIDAVIDIQGNVVEVQAVSGQPILAVAAMEALRRWKYEPTILGGEPVAVRLLVTITFESHRG